MGTVVSDRRTAELLPPEPVRPAHGGEFPPPTLARPVRTLVRLVHTRESLPHTLVHAVRAPEFPPRTLARPVHTGEFLPREPVRRVHIPEFLPRTPEFPLHGPERQRQESRYVVQKRLRHVACMNSGQVSSPECTPGSRTSFTVLEGKNAP